MLGALSVVTLVLPSPAPNHSVANLFIDNPHLWLFFDALQGSKLSCDLKIVVCPTNKNKLWRITNIISFVECQRKNKKVFLWSFANADTNCLPFLQIFCVIVDPGRLTVLN